MKKILGSILVAIAAIVGLSAVATPAYAANAPLDTHVFLGQGICLLDKTGSNQWRIGDVGNTAESGTSTVITGYRTTSCSDYGDSQTIKFYLYSEPDGNCRKTDVVTLPYPGVKWSTEYVVSATVWINTWYYADCRDTETERMNTVGQGMAYAFGQKIYSNCSVNDSVANRCFETAPGFWAMDRNALWLKYSDRY